MQFSAIPGVGSETGEVQFNVVPDDTGEGEQFGDVQFNDVPVAGSETGEVQFNVVPDNAREFREVQFNDVPVGYAGWR